MTTMNRVIPRFTNEEIRKKMEEFIEKKPVIRTKGKYLSNPLNLEDENFFFYINEKNKNWSNAFLKKLIVKSHFSAYAIKKYIAFDMGLDAWI